KRELYNLRPLSAAKLEEALGLLPAHAVPHVSAYAADLAERARVEEELRAAHGEEAPGLRDRFRELLRDPDFRAGLMVSSHALYGALDRYAQTGAELSGKDEKTERGLLRYYTRMAVKATPFSSFCAIIGGRFVENGQDAGEVLR